MTVKEGNTRHTLTISKELLRKVKERAEQEEIPPSIWIVQAIQNKLKGND